MDDDKPSNRQGLAVFLLPLEAAQVSPSKPPKSCRRLLQVGSGCRRDVLESLVVRAAELALNVKCATDDRDAMEELGLRSIADGGNLCHLAACTQPPYLEFSSRWGIAPGLVAPIAKALLADLSFLDAVATCRAQLSLDADDCALLTALKPAVVLVGRAPGEPEVDRLIAELVQVDGRTTRHAAGRTNQHDSGRVDVHLPANAGALHLSEYPVRPALMGFELDLHYPTPYLVRECVELVRRQAFFVDHRVCGPGPCADPVVASMEEGDCDSGRIQVWLGRVESEKLLRDGLAEILRRGKSTRALGRLRNAERLKRAYALWLLLQRGYDLHRIAQEVLGVDSRRSRDAVREWLRTACRQALEIEGAAVTQVALLRHASDRPLETASDRERRAYLRGRGFPLADRGQRVKPRVREVSDTSVSWADGSLLAEAGAELPAGRGKRWRRARVERRT